MRGGVAGATWAKPRTHPSINTTNRGIAKMLLPRPLRRLPEHTQSQAVSFECDH